jgi:Domain of unknown function (DUF5667)
VDSSFDELIDPKISRSLEGEADFDDGDHGGRPAAYEQIASEISRVLTEESPRLSTGARQIHLAQLREEARSRRSTTRAGFAWLLRIAPRLAQVAAIAIVALIMANGITIASASSLPGSPLYPVKRLAEQSNVFLAPTAGQRARLWMTLASRRLDEVQGLLAIQPRVDPRVLDDVDDSILHALTEIATTRGPERITLLEQIIQLSVREQTVLDGLAQKATTDDRVRFQQSARLLGDVARIAGSAQSNLVLPAPALTGTATASPGATSTETRILDEENLPTDTPFAPVIIPATESPLVTPTETETLGANSGDDGDYAPTQGNLVPGGGASETPKPRKNISPEGEKSVSPQPQTTEQPEREKTIAPERDRPDSPKRDGGSGGD